MNKQNNVTIQSLREQLVSELKKNNYTRGTIQLYTEHVNQILRYMAENDVNAYTSQIADEFYREVVKSRSYSERTHRFYRTVIRRLNDLYLGKGFVVSVPRKDLTLPESFRFTASAYLDYCEKNGNSSFTLKAKERAIHFFVTNLEQLGCHSFSELTAQLVSNASILIKNKEFYSELRDFVRYLNVSGYTDLDFSTLVPKHRRGFRIPATYTAEEISMVEQSVDTSVPPGKRDLAIILLASRLGIRAGDIAAMKFSNLDFEHDRICFVQNKTGNSSDLYMLPEIKAALLDYLGNERPSSLCELVFLKAIAPHDGISYSVVSFAVKKHMQRSGIDFSKKKHGPHSLRSSLATSMVNDGVNYDSVRKVLGHESENAIKHYARVDAVMLRRCALEAPEPSLAFKSFLEGGAL